MNIRKITSFALALTIAAVSMTGTADARRYEKQSAEEDAPQVRVCFYTETEFKRSHFCVTDMQRISFVEDAWKDRIESITVENASVRVCSEPKLRGECTTVHANNPELPPQVFDQVRSFNIR